MASSSSKCATSLPLTQYAGSSRNIESASTTPGTARGRVAIFARMSATPRAQSSWPSSRRSMCSRPRGGLAPGESGRTVPARLDASEAPDPEGDRPRDDEQADDMKPARLILKPAIASQKPPCRSSSVDRSPTSSIVPITKATATESPVMMML